LRSEFQLTTDDSRLWRSNVTGAHRRHLSSLNDVIHQRYVIARLIRAANAFWVI